MPIFAPLFEKILKDMYAIVDIAGQQFKVEENQKVIVNRLAANEGDSVEFNKVLLKDNDGQVEVGMPTLEGSKVTAKVLGHVKGDKVIIFKKKRRKGYQKRTGFRASLTQIQIEKRIEQWHIRKASVVPITAVSQKANAWV